MDQRFCLTSIKQKTMKIWKNGVTPRAPYFAVIFISVKSEHQEGFKEMDEKTLELATGFPGYLGHETMGDGSKNIFISYWDTMESIEKWKNHQVHLMAKAKGIQQWYDYYLSQICEVKSAHELNRLP